MSEEQEKSLGIKGLLLKPIQNRLLIPLFTLLLLLIAAFSTVIITLQQDKLNEFATHLTQRASIDLSQLLDKQAKSLAAIQMVIFEDPDLRRAMKNLTVTICWLYMNPFGIN